MAAKKASSKITFTILIFIALCAVSGVCEEVGSEPAAQDIGLLIVAAAREQVGVTTTYDRAYVRLAYPMGDIPIERGVCTDVIIRALRKALGMDLQQLIHKDMAAAFSEYPKNWGLTAPDRNIDHRRVPNQKKYFSRRGWALAIPKNPQDYRPGDFVTSMLPGNLPHIMVVSDKKTDGGVPLVIHNIGMGTLEDDYLFVYPITGHYRVKAVSKTSP